MEGMKHSYLHLAYGAKRTTLLAALACCGSAYAENSVTLYGRLNTAVEQAWGTGGISRISNYRSAIGFRGQEALGDGLSVVWQIEGSVNMDNGNGNSFANRDTRIGMIGSWGTLFAGNWMLPYTAATSAFDPFYPTTAGYMSLMGNGAAPSTNSVQDTTSFDRRQQNVVQYWTPTWHGWSAKLAYSPGEDRSAITGARPTVSSSSVTYSGDGFTLVAAGELHRNFQTANSTDRATKVGGSISLGATKLSAVVERVDYRTGSGRLKRDAAYVSAVHKRERLSLLAGMTWAGDGKGSSVIQLGGLSSGKQTGAFQFTVGAEYSMSGRTTLYTFASRLKNDQFAQYDFAINGIDPAAGARLSLLSAGIRHSF